MQVTKDMIVDEVKNLDPKLDKSREEFKVATILLAGITVGANVKKIAKFLDLPEKDVRKYEKVLRDNGIWEGEKTACEWMDEESGGFAFWLDVNVAMGHMEKVDVKN